MASTPHEGAADPSQGASPDPQQAVSAMQQAMQELQAGQQPSPEVAKAIVEFFEQFTGGEPEGDESGDPMSGFDAA